MKEILKKILLYVLLVGIFLVFSIVIDLLVFNFDLLTLDEEDKGIWEITTYSDEIIDKNRVIGIDFNDRYVEKLIVNYEVEKDVEINISYVEDDYYGNDKTSYLEDIFGNEVDKQITYYGNNIKDLSFIMNADSKVSIKELMVDNRIKVNYFRVIYLMSFMLVIYIIYKFYKNGGCTKNIHRYFLLLGLILGSIMIFLQPASTYYSWDDQIHFMNTYELIGGNFEWEIGEFAMIDGENAGKRNINSIEEQENYKEYLNSGYSTSYSTYEDPFITYNKVAYIPSAIGFYLCKLLNLPFVLCFKMGKFMNLLVYLLIYTYAIKITKNYKRLLTIIGFIPTSIFLASNYSYDSAVMGGITLGIVCLFNWLLDKDSKVDFKSFSIFVFAMLYGCFPKAVYAPLLLIFLFVPKEKFKSKKESIYLKTGVIVLCFLMLMTFILPTITNSVEGDSRGGATSVSEQIKVILDNPIGYIKILKDTMVYNFMEYFLGKDLIGFYSYLGQINNNLYLSFVVLLLFVWATEEVKISLKLKNRFIILLGIIGVILLIWTALYLSFTPVGLNVINGVQPRYFIPLLLPLLCLFKGNKIKNNFSSRLYNTLVISIPVIVIIISIYQLFILNYCM